jgi:hypothetical protein
MGKTNMFMKLCFIRINFHSFYRIPYRCTYDVKKLPCKATHKFHYQPTILGRFEVLTAASMKVAVVWLLALYSVVEVYQRFRGACCLHHQGALIMEAASW